MEESDPPGDSGPRVGANVNPADLGWVATALRQRRDQVLSDWLAAVREQPFHAGRPERAVADEIPRLYDALVELLERRAPGWIAAPAPLDGESLLAAATSHAVARAEQGLQPRDVVIEFRLLRQEIWRALRVSLPASVPADDVAAVQLLLNDALDGAITLALASLAERLDAVREDFLATTVHDVRQPLTAIRGSAQLANRLLRRSPLDRERISQQLERIESTATRMADLLATLIDSSRAAVGQLDIQVEPADLVALIRAVIDRLDGSLPERIRLEVRPGLDTSGSWDPSRLQQVLANLVSNAIKYSAAESPIELLVDGDEERLRLAVRDYGIGIAPEDLSRLFQRYVRTRTAVEQRIGGLGLGLYLSRAIVQVHGGRIWTESEGPGRGATFWVELPRHTRLDG